MTALFELRLKPNAEEAAAGWRRAVAAAELAEQLRRSPHVSPEHLALAHQLLQREAAQDSGGGDELKDMARMAEAALSLR